MDPSTIAIRGKEYTIDWCDPIDISIPMRFGGPQPNAYGVERAGSEAVEAGGLVGDTRRGGSCNFERVTLIPHCNGTHTECVGHITHERVSVNDCLSDILVPASLVTVEPEDAVTSDESYVLGFGEGDQLVTRTMLENSMDKRVLPPRPRDADTPPTKEGSLKCLIVRTLPNGIDKLSRRYNESNVPPYFSSEAMEFIVEHGFRHLLVDLPSIDRLFDKGKLANHRKFWNLDVRSFDAGSDARREATVTELIYVPDDIPDGEYLLNLQIAPFASDASPSRPILFKIFG